MESADVRPKRRRLVSVLRVWRRHCTSTARMCCRRRMRSTRSRRRRHQHQRRRTPRCRYSARRQSSPLQFVSTPSRFTPPPTPRCPLQPPGPGSGASRPREQAAGVRRKEQGDAAACVYNGNALTSLLHVRGSGSLRVPICRPHPPPSSTAVQQGVHHGPKFLRVFQARLGKKPDEHAHGA